MMDKKSKHKSSQCVKRYKMHLVWMDSTSVIWESVLEWNPGYSTALINDSSLGCLIYTIASFIHLPHLYDCLIYTFASFIHLPHLYNCLIYTIASKYSLTGTPDSCQGNNMQQIKSYAFWSMVDRTVILYLVWCLPLAKHFRTWGRRCRRRIALHILLHTFLMSSDIWIHTCTCTRLLFQITAPQSSQLYSSPYGVTTSSFLSFI